MAAAMEDRNRSLKQALIDSLTAILSPDQQSRQMAEEQLKVLEVTEGRVCELLKIYRERCALLNIKMKNVLVDVHFTECSLVC